MLFVDVIVYQTYDISRNSLEYIDGKKDAGRVCHRYESLESNASRRRIYKKYNVPKDMIQHTEGVGGRDINWYSPSRNSRVARGA